MVILVQSSGHPGQNQQSQKPQPPKGPDHIPPHPSIDLEEFVRAGEAGMYVSGWQLGLTALSPEEKARIKDASASVHFEDQK